MHVKGQENTYRPTYARCMHALPFYDMPSEKRRQTSSETDGDALDEIIIHV